MSNNVLSPVITMFTAVVAAILLWVPVVEAQGTCGALQACICYTGTSCPGFGIDPRIVTGIVAPPTMAPVNGVCPAGTIRCCGAMVSKNQTGTRFTIPGSPTPPGAAYAPFAAYPWTAIIMLQNNAGPPFVGGGVMLDQYHILTAAHKVVNYSCIGGYQPDTIACSYSNNLAQIKVRMGDWDVRTTTEPYGYCEAQVSRLWIHPGFRNLLTVENQLENDIAILRLATPIPPGIQPNINNILLPASAVTTYIGQRCWVDGWGRLAYNSPDDANFPTILKHVNVPIVDGATCTNRLRTNPGFETFNLNTNSFICAGGESNNDACTDDGGNGLVCLNSATNKWSLAGLVAWGKGCGRPDMFGVYVNVPSFLPWIQNILATSAPPV